MSDCPQKEDLVESGLDRLLTQYRESPNLITVIREGLSQVAEASLRICDIPTYFDIRTAVGDQLTILGKRLGWPRCHCVCETGPVFGFSCGETNPNRPVVGFCENSTWASCQSFGSGDLCLDDDEVYRGFLLARRYQALQRYSLEDLQNAMQHIWGETAAAVSMGNARISLSPGRALTAREEQELPLALRVLPVAPGIAIYVNRSVGRLFGFGTGWAGFCEDAVWHCPDPVDPYACN
ncbi:Protein of unknown function [Aureimonas altamirensis DSM 21988]|uniref:Uncharacterized protein n=2 Tax=Aureimonas altamirensis TaxID=370622 RepID=A0A0P0YXS4_9HYPH|nr:DUF2612 domain-containing protein [Aureimonas altamirensis]BAT26079.1 hypothetical protein [Aureimonas altamirensis]SHI80521.1 Protein of unknown function [Aureimonas altamirensis DSM 21988]